MRVRGVGWEKNVLSYNRVVREGLQDLDYVLNDHWLLCWK